MKTVNWKEETKLTTGQVIIVERSQDYRSVYSGGAYRPGWLFDYERIRARFPSPSGVITWEGRLTPLALDIAADGQIYLVAVAAAAAGAKEYHLKPDEYHVAFEYESSRSQWKQIALGKVPQQLRPNLLADTWGLFIQQRSTVDLVDLALKAKVDSDPRIVWFYKNWPR
jgi:hypothetical protein